MNNELKNLKSQQIKILEKMATILSALASPVRLHLLHFLSQSPLSVEVLANKVDQSIANTSANLRKMNQAGIVESIKDGQKRFYKLKPSLLDFWESIQNFAQEIEPNLKLDFNNYGNITWDKSLEQTVHMIMSKNVTLIDVRPSDEIELLVESNINIIHCDINKIEEGKLNLPKTKPLLIFCRGRFCALSAHAVAALRNSGHNAYRLEYSWHQLKHEIKELA